MRYTRETYDALTGELINITKGYANATVVDEEIPPPVPRATRTLFYFSALPRKLPPEALALYTSISLAAAAHMAPVTPVGCLENAELCASLLSSMN